jgi:hypothetical protein
MSNNKQSSIEWFANESCQVKVQLDNQEISLDEYAVSYVRLLYKAKAMHKQECVDLLNHHNDIFDTSEEHYNKTFGDNNEQAMIDYNKMEEESEIDNYNEMNNEQQ